MYQGNQSLHVIIKAGYAAKEEFTYMHSQWKCHQFFAFLKLGIIITHPVKERKKEARQKTKMKNLTFKIKLKKMKKNRVPVLLLSVSSTMMLSAQQ